MATVNNTLIKEEKKVSFSNFLTNEFVKKKIFETVGSMDAQRFMTNILSAVTNNETLQECNQMSILNCAFLGQSLNLIPSPQLGQYYMVPFNTKVGIDENGQNIYAKKVSFVLGYKGYLQLAIRSGKYKDIGVLEIREGEYKGRNRSTGKHEFEFIQDDDERESKPIIGYMAYYEYLNGFTKAIYWTKEKMLNHADKYSPAFSKKAYEKILNGEIPQKDMWRYSSFWYKDFDGMAYKTMLRQLISKWGIMSVEMQEGYIKDGAEIREDGTYSYIPNAEELLEPQETPEIEGQTIEESKDNQVQEQPEKNVETQNKTQEDIINDFFNQE